MNQNKSKTWITLPYIIVLSSYFVENLGHMLNTSMAAPFAKSLGITGTLLNIIPGLMSLAAMFCRPISGWISDRFNRRYSNLIVLLSFVLIFIGYAFTTNGIVLLIMRIINGFAFGIFTTVSMSMIADSVNEKKLVVASTYYGLMGALTAAIAPTLGVFLKNTFSYRGMYLAFAGFFLVATGFLAFMTSRTEKKEQPKKDFTFSFKQLISVVSIPLSVVGMMAGVADGAIQSLLLVSAESRGIANAGIFFTFSAIISVASRPFISLLLKKIKANVLLIPCLGFICLALLALSFADNTGLLILAGILNGMGYGTAQGLIQGLILMNVPPTERGVASSTMYIGLDIGHFLGPTLMGVVVTATGDNYGMGWLSIILYVVAGIIVMLFINSKDRRMAKKAAADNK